jgi:YHS domain-containing protein
MPIRPRTPLPLLGGLVAFLGASGAALHFLNQSPAAAPSTQGHVEAEAHASNVQSFGNCHIEAQTTRDGKLTLMVYGMKDKDLLPIETDPPMEAQCMTVGQDARPIALTPQPYPGEPKGSSSRFVGQLPGFQPGQTGLTLTIPFQGRNYRVQWTGVGLMPGAAAGGGGEVAMPQALGSDEAQKLFLTPGGLYTQADIEANGRTTATAKYGSQMSAHNAHPKPGDALCPISETAANPKFAWTVGGKRYTFCCPPCIEEFVRKAKETPEKVKTPEEYVQP